MTKRNFDAHNFKSFQEKLENLEAAEMSEETRLSVREALSFAENLAGS